MFRVDIVIFGKFNQSTCIGDEQTRIITINKNQEKDKEIERALFRENKQTNTHTQRGESDEQSFLGLI